MNLLYPFEGPPELGETVDRALRKVVDPEVALNIVDVGLVQGVALRGSELHVEVTMTSAACPVADVIVGDIETELDATLPEGLMIRVELTWEPAWTPDRMSDGAKRFMGW